MVLFGFTVAKARENIESGRKNTTIRSFSEGRCKSILTHGMHFYEHPRTRNVRFIAYFPADTIDTITFADMSDEELEKTAYNDGFDSVEEMREFFEQQYEDYETKQFQIVRWSPDRGVFENDLAGITSEGLKKYLKSQGWVEKSPEKYRLGEVMVRVKSATASEKLQTLRKISERSGRGIREVTDGVLALEDTEASA